RATSSASRVSTTRNTSALCARMVCHPNCNDSPTKNGGCFISCCWLLYTRFLELAFGRICRRANPPAAPAHGPAIAGQRSAVQFLTGRTQVRPSPVNKHAKTRHKAGLRFRLLRGQELHLRPSGYAYHYGFRRSKIDLWSGLYLLPFCTVYKSRESAV
ncbi:MAG: hypothetical protein UY83_C0016G0001, partial [Candidatus Adlerbacteria bacterium GW2011_GWA1_54_10]